MLGPLLKDIDNWLWRRGISHPVILPLVRNLILFTGICLGMGGVGYAHMPGLFWFGVGAAMITWTFWGLARLFLRQPLGEYSTAFLRVVLLRWGGRLAVLAVVTYVALAVCGAPLTALLGGLAAATALALITYAWASRAAGKR